MSIHNFANKIKGWAGERRQILIFIGLLVGVSGLSFYLGYTARAEGHKEPLVAINCPVSAYIDPLAMASNEKGATQPSSSPLGASAIGAIQNQGAYVASKNGKKYYPLDCPGAKRIKDDNKVFFETSQSAEAAGYSLGTGCNS